MKYFLPEFDINVPNLTQEECERRERQWELACKEYADYMQKNLKIFSKSFKALIFFNFCAIASIICC